MQQGCWFARTGLVCWVLVFCKWTQIHFGGKAHGQTCSVQNLAATLPSGRAAPASNGGLRGSASQRWLLRRGRGGGDALSFLCWSDAEDCRQSSPSFTTGSLWAATSCSGLSAHLPLVQLDLYKLIFLNILFPVNLMWQKKVCFSSVPILLWLSSFWAKWEISF